MKTRTFYLMFYGGTFHFINAKLEGWKLREAENHHQINSFRSRCHAISLYSMVIHCFFQQMVYFLFSFTSAKRHTLLSFNKLPPQTSPFFPHMNLSLVSWARSVEEIGESKRTAKYIKHVQVSFPYKSQYMNW
jgi:hypothetical protein